jgi:hypothetical protein
MGLYQLLNLYCPYATWFGRKRTVYIGIIRGRSAGKEVTTEFTLLGSLDAQINKKGGGCYEFLVTNKKQIKQKTITKSFCVFIFIR